MDLSKSLCVVSTSRKTGGVPKFLPVLRLSNLPWVTSVPTPGMEGRLGTLRWVFRAVSCVQIRVNAARIRPGAAGRSGVN